MPTDIEKICSNCHFFREITTVSNYDGAHEHECANYPTAQYILVGKVGEYEVQSYYIRVGPKYWCKEWRDKDA